MDMDSIFRLPARVRADNLMSVAQEVDAWWAQHTDDASQRVIDCTALVDVDVTLLTLFVEWQRRAHQQAHCLVLQSVPDAIQRMMTLFGLNPYLPTAVSRT